MPNYNRANAFLQGAAGGVGLTMQVDKFLRDRDREEIVQKQQDEMFAMQRRLSELGLEEAEDAVVRKNMLRDIDTIELALQSGEATPQALDAFNRVYGNTINIGGPEGSKKRVITAYPTPDGSGFIPEVEVKTKDGKTYRAPMTSPNRDPSDREVMAVGFDELFTDLHNRKTALTQLEQMRVKYGDRSPITSRAEIAKEDRKHQHKLAEIEAQQKAKASYFRSTWGARPSSDMQWLNVLTSPEIGMSKREAVDYLMRYRMTAKTNPAETSRKIAQDLMRSRDKRGLMHGDPEYLSDEQIHSVSQEMANSMYSQFPSAPGLGLTLPPPRTNAAPDATQAPDPRRDYLLGPSSRTGLSLSVPAAGGGTRTLPPSQSAPAPAPTPQAEPEAPAPQEQQLPPSAMDALRKNPGKAVRFANGQVWMIDGSGRAVRVK